MYLKACLFETEYGGDGRGTFGRAGHQMHGRGAQQWNYISQDPCVSFYVGKRRGIGADFADSPNPEHLQLTVLCVTVTTQWETVGMQRLCLAPVNRFQSTSSTETGIYIKELIGYLPNETLDQVLEGSQSHLSRSYQLQVVALDTIRSMAIEQHFLHAKCATDKSDSAQTG